MWRHAGNWPIRSPSSFASWGSLWDWGIASLLVEWVRRQTQSIGVDSGAGVKIYQPHLQLDTSPISPTTLTLSLCVSTDMVSQALELSNQPHVVVATPGRLADHIRSSSTFSMSKIQFLVRTTNYSLTGLPQSSLWESQLVCAFKLLLLYRSTLLILGVLTC